jgi:hypothetical protein
MMALILRHGMTAVGTLLMAKGWLTDSDSALFSQAAAELVGAVITLGGLSWSAARKVSRAKRATDVWPAK